MKCYLMFLIAALLVFSVSFAAEKPKSSPGFTPPYHHTSAGIFENEPNDNCTQADGPLVSGGAIDGEIGCCRVKEDHFDDYPLFGHTGYANVPVQSFTPTHNYQLCKVSVVLNGGGGPATLYVQNGCSASATPYTQATISSVGTEGWYTFDVPNINVSQGQVYYIRVEGATWRCYRAFDPPETDPYPRGGAYVNCFYLDDDYPPGNDFNDYWFTVHSVDESCDVDVDWFAFGATENDVVVFETHPTPNMSTMDTKLYLYSSDCTTVLASNDDGGSGLYSRISYTFTAGGTYYVVVTGFDEYETGFYTLTTNVFNFYCENPTCATAIDLQEQGLAQFYTNTCGCVDDYSPANECTGYSAHGEDCVYKIYLLAGEVFTVTLTEEDYDASIYLLTDCSDMYSCVAGGDDPEEFSYMATSSGWYYLIIDGYGTDSCGVALVTIDTPINTETCTWGGVKALYR